MHQEEKTFTLRFTLEASFPENYDGEEDQMAWVREWEALIKPEMLKRVFEALRQQSGWTSRVRNRGMSPTDEIEVVLARDYSQPRLFPL